MEGTPVRDLSIGGQIAAVVFPLAVAALGGAIVTDFKGAGRRRIGPPR
ncbi:hypothetical protein [Streptomyces sp. ERV7]|nr:hypothetical protein [Streptomyces sp. ERV7]